MQNDSGLCIAGIAGFEAFALCFFDYIISICTSYDVMGGFFAVFFGIFRTSSIRTSSPRGEPRRPTVVGCRGLKVWRRRRESDSQVFYHPN